MVSGQEGEFVLLPLASSNQASFYLPPILLDCKESYIVGRPDPPKQNSEPDNGLNRSKVIYQILFLPLLNPSNCS